jgi:hypothetical protein
MFKQNHQQLNQNQQLKEKKSSKAQAKSTTEKLKSSATE